MLREFALYDLDKTILRRASYTPFLIYAARRRKPWRVAFLPIWVGAMAAYKLGVCSRGALKQFGLRLFLGVGQSEAGIRQLGEQFADHVMPGWIAEGARRSIAHDREAGRQLVMVTAAMGFYAEPISRRLGFDDVIATGHRIQEGRCLLKGDNCYGATKVARVETWLAEEGIERSEARFSFYSDSLSDAPLFDWSDEAVLVNGSASRNAQAVHRGWRIACF